MTVGYTRLSFDKYEDQLGVTRQRQDIAALAGALGWPDITEFYEDNDVSANVDRRKPRPEFDRLLRDMRAGVVIRVLCYDQDRLVRDMRQLEDVVDAVEAGQVMLTSVNGDIDLRSDNGRMVARIKAAVARHEVEKLSRRIKRQKLQRSQLGFKNASANRTFGYERDFAVVPAEAAILVELFERRGTGEGIPALVTWLNESGAKSTTGLVGRWRHGGVTDLLRRREYVGDVTMNGAVVGRAAFEAIINRDVFEKVNVQFPVRPAPWRATDETGLLTGLLVCAGCGTRMRRGRGATSLRLYSCQRRSSQPRCSSSLSVAVDPYVVEAVGARMRELATGGIWRSKQADAIEHEIEQARRLHARGALNRAELDSILKHLSQRLAAERRRPGQPADSPVPDDWTEWAIDAQREWLATVVDQVVIAKSLRGSPGPRVDFDRVTIHFKDGQTRNIGRPVVRLRDVADLAGCTAHHAGRALHGTGQVSPETRERVRAAADELGYVMTPGRRSIGSS